jgi:adenine-specific DNA-methyltransferase
MPTGKLNSNNTCYNEDTNTLIRRISADLVYIDPPYNSRQYCDAYHLLENIAKWEKPEVFGVARKMDRTALKSNYNTNKATSAFEDLIKNINAKYILFSYNNMANKGNDRSNAKIADKDIMRILSEKGKVKVFTQEYKAFSTGKSDISDNEERLFLCICKQKTEDFIQSPLNYTGGKCKLLPQIMPLFPNKIDTFVDLFCGGCNVGVNVIADKVIFNDINHELYHLYTTFKNLDKRKILSDIENIIDDYQLSKSDKYGYTHYNCNSSDGLGEYNRDKFLKLRDDFNNNTGIYEHSLMLYVLIVYAFNNQIRFNSKAEFNLPVGKRDFNPKMKSKLCNFINKIQETDFSFSNKNFRDVDLSKLTEKSLVYCDPPYLITCASYNERDGWNEQDERDLLDFLDRLNEKKIKFALSNVLTSKGNTNTILLDWIEKNNYRVTHLNCDYSNSNYQVKDRTVVADEVLITNY